MPELELAWAPVSVLQLGLESEKGATSVPELELELAWAPVSVLQLGLESEKGATSVSELVAPLAPELVPE